MRAELWSALEAGDAELLCATCPYAKVLWIRRKHTRDSPNWTLWGRIFQWFGFQAKEKQWRVFWFPSHSLRQMPGQNEDILPGHINGGYTIPCLHNKIVIYRKEEAERVLIHELQHASCLDNMNEAIEMREARVEFWAELFLVAICSKGSKQRAARLWKQQSQWLVNQNYALKSVYKIQSTQEYVWRYTLGRELIAEELRIALPSPTSARNRSLRLTSPRLLD